ncbi:MAG TPA: tetratricopeptide repeat protein [Pyrinomonadaceae bacterium]|nr:tetratricopeptide repeat protein [Pyrinomonadaceae bacterium]
MFRRFTLPLVIALLCVLAAPARFAVYARTPAPQGEIVLVLPFENTSSQREFNWVGESFADSIAELLGAHGLTVVSGDAREIAYNRLSLPLVVIPSRATAIKLAREAGASLLVLGTYEVSPAPDEKSVPEVRGSARVIRVNEGRLAGKVMDGRWASHEFFFGDALVNLQTVQGKLAYQILYEQDDKLPFSQKAIVEQATKVPAKAFESYVKGTMTGDSEKKSAYLQNAMREYAKANPGAIYAQAAFELGHLYLFQRDYKNATEHFSMLGKRDPHYAEAAFYSALSYWHMGQAQSALDALMPLTSEMPLTSVYNNAGAIATQAARSEKDATKRENLLKQATTFLGRAVESAPEVSPDGTMVRYNYAYALMLAGRYAEAVEQLRAVVKRSPRDGEALYLFAKALEKSGQAEAATANDNEARKFFPGYAKAQVEWQKSQTTMEIPLRLRGDFNRADYVSVLLEQQEEQNNIRNAGSNTQDLLAKAREMYTAGRDDEALMELRDVVRVEPMNAEAYLLTGRIYQRRGELALAINQLKTSLFWDSKLIDAHILLGRIFLERGDRSQAMAYARNAMQINPNNQEAIALQRQVEVGIK